MQICCDAETWSFIKSTKSAAIAQIARTALFFFKGPNSILSNDSDHAGAQIVPVLSKQTRIGRINSLLLLFPVLLSKT